MEFMALLETNLILSSYTSNGRYDILFTWNQGGNTFNGTETAVYLISGSGITAELFNAFSKPEGGSGPFLSAAHIQGISTGAGSTYVAPVPEPATMLISALTLAGAGGFVRRKFFKKG